MKAIPGFFSIIVLFVSIFQFSFADEGLEKGDIMPNPKFRTINRIVDGNSKPVELYDYKGDDVLLIAFMPSVSDNNSYAKVMTSAFDTYFAEGLSFRTNSSDIPEKKIKVLVVTKDNESLIKDFASKMNLNYDMVSDKDMNFSNFFGIKGFKSSESSSYVYIINKDNEISYVNNYYRGEGEKLRAVQSELFSLLGINEVNANGNNFTPLITGDKSSDFEFEYITSSEYGLFETKKAKLSDYAGKKNVLLAFYPAPYSFSCAAEVSSFEKYAAQEEMINNLENTEIGNDVEIIMVSISNFYILGKWKNELGLENLRMVNDTNGEISLKYNSYNTYGYNNRTVFIINKEGNVSYINWNYNVDNDFNEVKDKLMALD